MDNHDADLTAIRRTIAEAQRHQADVEPFVGLHSADAVIVNIVGRRVLGRDGIHEAMRAAMATPLGEVLTRVEVEDIRFVTADVALVSCVKHVPAATDHPERPTQGALSYVVVREPDAWRIALAQTTARPA